MATNEEKLERLLVQVRRIAEHREAQAVKEIRKTYKQLLKELKQFIGYEYAELAENGELTYEILAKKQSQARFLEEVKNRVDEIEPQVKKEIDDLVQQTYSATYTGAIDAIQKAAPKAIKDVLQGVDFVQPEQIRRTVQNDLMDEVLGKNHREFVYDIKREIHTGLVNGDRVNTMAKRISKSIDTSYNKAVRIARTETHRVREAGMNDGARSYDEQLKDGMSGMRMVKIWRTMKDDRVRPLRGRGKKRARGGANHLMMEGQAVLADEKFTLSDGNKTDAPGQSGIANQDINCRCYVRYSLMSDEEFYDMTGRHFPK